MTSQSRTVVLLSAILALTGCSGTSPSPVFVGHIVSHLDRTSGKSAARGIRLAVIEANKDPDKGAGRPVKVIHTDTVGKLEGFEGEAVRLVAINRVAALLGGTTLEEVERLEMGSAPLKEEKRLDLAVPVLSPCGMRPRTATDAVFCTGLSPASRGKILARFAVDELKIQRTVVLVDERREECLRLADVFTRQFPLAAAKNDPKATPARPTLLRFDKDNELLDRVPVLKDMKPGLLLFLGTTTDLRRLRQELHDPALPVLFGGDESNLRPLLEDRETGEKVYLVTAFAVDADVPRAQEFAKQFKATFADEPDVHAALAYDDARLLFEAIRQTKDELTGPRLRDELAKLKDFPGLTGMLSFGEDRQLRRPAFVVRLQDGRPR